MRCDAMSSAPMESDDPQGSGDARAMLAAGDSMSIYFGGLHSFAHPRGLSGYFQFAKNVLSQCLRERLISNGCVYCVRISQVVNNALS